MPQQIASNLNNPQGVQTPVVISLDISTSSQTLNWSNLGTGRVSEFRITLQTSPIALTFEGGKDGSRLVLTVYQDATGGRVITWGSEIEFSVSADIDLTANAVTFLGFIYNLADSKYMLVANSNSTITTTGTITSGVWHGTPIEVAYGGTGQTSYTDGQLLIGNSVGNTLTKNTLTAPSNGISITNGHGTITFALTNDLAAVEGLASTGLATRTATDTWTTRTITGTTSRLTVTNGDGISGDPTLDISSAYPADEDFFWGVVNIIGSDLGDLSDIVFLSNIDLGDLAGCGDILTAGFIQIDLGII